MFLQKFANNFALSDAEDNTYWRLNRGAIADLSLLITLLAIRQKSREPSFGEVMKSFALLAHASLGAPFATITSLSELLLQCICSVGINKKAISMNNSSNTRS